MRPSLLPLKNSVLTESRYTYGDLLLFGDYVRFGGLGDSINSNPKDIIQLSIENNIKVGLGNCVNKVQNIGETYEPVVISRGQPLGMLMAITASESTQYIVHTSGTSNTNSLAVGPHLEVK